MKLICLILSLSAALGESKLNAVFKSGTAVEAKTVGGACMNYLSACAQSDACMAWATSQQTVPTQPADVLGASTSCGVAATWVFGFISNFAHKLPKPISDLKTVNKPPESWTAWIKSFFVNDPVKNFADLGAAFKKAAAGAVYYIDVAKVGGGNTDHYLLIFSDDNNLMAIQAYQDHYTVQGWLTGTEHPGGAAAKIKPGSATARNAGRAFQHVQGFGGVAKATFADEVIKLDNLNAAGLTAFANLFGVDGTGMTKLTLRNAYHVPYTQQACAAAHAAKPP